MSNDHVHHVLEQWRRELPTLDRSPMGVVGRMEPISDLPTLQTHLEALASRDLVVFLSPRGQRRGVMVTHGLYRPEELEREKQKHAHGAPEVDDEPAARVSSGRSSTPGLAAEVAALREELAILRETVKGLEAELTALKTSLGA